MDSKDYTSIGVDCTEFMYAGSFGVCETRFVRLRNPQRRPNLPPSGLLEPYHYAISIRSQSRGTDCERYIVQQMTR
jgi:hypothetical protein